MKMMILFSPSTEISAPSAASIRDYVTQEGRWASPKYLAGESYGTLRACGLSESLAEKGLFLNGLILISCAIDYQTLECDLDNAVPYAYLLPSFAATAWYHHRLDHKLSLEETIEQARRFAIGELAPALLLGPVPPDLYEGYRQVERTQHRDRRAK